MASICTGQSPIYIHPCVGVYAGGYVHFVDDRTQDINIRNMNVELVSQMFKNYQSNVLFHLEGKFPEAYRIHIVGLCAERGLRLKCYLTATDELKDPS